MAWNGSGKVQSAKGGVRSAKGGVQSANGAQSTKHKAQGTRHGLVAGLLVVILGGAAAWWFCGDRGHAGRVTLPDGGRDGARPSRIVEKKPAAVPKAATNAPVKVKAAVKAPAPVAPKVPDGMVAVTNAGKVIFMTPKEAETFRRACRDTTLRTKTEKRLKLLASIPIGSPVPPMPGAIDMDADLQATLSNKIEILPDDTEREIEQKKFVIGFKEYMIEEINAGKTANQVYAEYVQLMNKVATLTTEGAKMARDMKSQGDLEGAKQFLEKVNAKIVEMGGNPIDLNHRPKGMSGKAKEQKQ